MYISYLKMVIFQSAILMKNMYDTLSINEIFCISTGDRRISEPSTVVVWFFPYPPPTCLCKHFHTSGVLKKKTTTFFPAQIFPICRPPTFEPLRYLSTFGYGLEVPCDPKKPKVMSSWNSKQPVFYGCLVISNHFSCKDFESSSWNNH